MNILLKLNQNMTKIMLTKYINGKNYALVAGYNEIGETLEETVIREVKEEVGLNVNKIKTPNIVILYWFIYI